MLRATLPEVRNPLLALPAAARLMALPADSRAALRDLLTDISNDAGLRSKKCWAQRKAPMAAYWYALGVYARHARRVLK